MLLLTYIDVLYTEPHGAHEVHLVFMTFIMKFVMTLITTHPTTLRWRTLVHHRNVGRHHHWIRSTIVVVDLSMYI